MTDQFSKKSEAWSARFAEPVSELVKRYTASVSFDQRLALFDIEGSLAHADMLHACGILSEADLHAIGNGLARIRAEIDDGRFRWSLDLEDVHLNIEKRLTDLAGDAGKRLHTARSRNDQVATDVRLWLRSAIDTIGGLLVALQRALVDLAQRHTDTIMPGFTHLQVAQPVVFGHHLMAYVEMFARDAERMSEVRRRTNRLPLGALCAGTSWALQEAIGLDLLPGAAGASRPWPWLAPALAGAALASALLYWLRLRAIAQGPADTSARLAELQSRIRPHFLFNTLNTAITLARVDPARTEELLEDLAELFRVALADTDAAVTLGSEVELAQRYLAIEQIRFGERLRVTWELDPAAAPARVPPLLLQPLVENAVRHGVEPAPDGGQIRVRTRVRRGQVVLSIDNSLHQHAPSRPGAGMALRNVRERLHLMHDVAGHFEARADGDVFRVRIELPLESRA